MNADLLRKVQQEVQQEEQRETAQELAEITRLAQEMGRRLANETHGELYDEVRLMLNLLHQTRAQADLINSHLNANYLTEERAKLYLHH